MLPPLRVAPLEKATVSSPPPALTDVADVVARISTRSDPVPALTTRPSTSVWEKVPPPWPETEPGETVTVRPVAAAVSSRGARPLPPWQLKVNEAAREAAGVTGLPTVIVSSPPAAL